MPVITSVIVMALSAAALPPEQVDQLWADFQVTYNRRYNSTAEAAQRRAVFEDSLRDAARWQARLLLLVRLLVVYSALACV